MQYLKQNRNFLLKTAGLIGLFLFCLFLRMQIFILAYVPSESMAPTLQKGDFLFATKYDKADLERYDVVLFDFPDNERLCFVKRIIGLPGDTIEIKNGKVYANGTLCCDDFTAELSCDDGIYQVPKGCYFMMGDNRNHSHDSRFWKHPFVKQSQIRGKVKYVLFPFSNARAIS